MAGRSRSVIDAAVADINGETAGIELCLDEAGVRQPGKVTRSGWRAAREIARHDLVLALISLFGREIRLNGDNLGLCGNERQLVHSEPDNDIAIAERVGLLS